MRLHLALLQVQAQLAAIASLVSCACVQLPASVRIVHTMGVLRAGLKGKGLLVPPWQTLSVFGWPGPLISPLLF